MSPAATAGYWCEDDDTLDCVSFLFVDAAEYHHPAGSAFPKRLFIAHIWNELRQDRGLAAVVA